MPFPIPPSTNYPTPLKYVNSSVLNEPKEGNRLIPVEINWGSMGGANNCVSFNVQDNATLEFSQIVSLAIDNTSCAEDVVFIFPDTGVTLAVPAYAPSLITPVFNNTKQFYVSCPAARDIDQTRFAILNHLPPPVAIPFTVEQETAIFNQISNDGASVTQLIPAGVSGTVEYIRVTTATGGATVQFHRSMQVVDGTGAVLAGGQVDVKNGDTSNFVAIDMQNVHLRFDNGLQMTQGGDVVNEGYIAASVLYRAP